jgi:hypothetical protein
MGNQKALAGKCSVEGSHYEKVAGLPRYIDLSTMVCLPSEIIWLHNDLISVS